MKNLLLIAWGVLPLGWSVLVMVIGEFKFGRYHGTPITPAVHFWFFWAVVLASAVLGSTSIITGVVGARRELLDLDHAGDKYDRYD